MFSFGSKNGPVKYCIVFLKFGCAHVDGLLCNFESCEERLKQEFTELKQTLKQSSDIKLNLDEM